MVLRNKVEKQKVRSSCKPYIHSHSEDVECVHGAPGHLKVVLEYGDRPRQSLVSTAAEQRHTSVQQDGGDEGRVRDPTQTFDAALQAS